MQFPVSLPVTPPVSAPSLFRHFAAVPAPSVPVPAAPLLSPLPSAPSAPVFYLGPSPSSSETPPPFLLDLSFVASDEFPVGVASAALPHNAGSAVPAAVLEWVRSEFLRVRSILVDLFPQAAGAPAPPRALFEVFFGSSAPASSRVCLSWFERVHTALF